LHAQADGNLTARIFASLDAEPTIMVAADKRVSVAKDVAIKRFAVPGMAMAAVAIAAFLTVPQMMKQNESAVIAAKPAAIVMASAAPATVTVASQDGDVLRDPRIDEYLLAHQRFSPSVYSTAQYARSATFAVDSDK
jgi:sigma-E factor negative regulatory protein RseA